MIEKYKFQKLRVYQMALDYVGAIYDQAKNMPDHEKYNLVSQIRRAATSIPLNIAEGSTGQSNTEQQRYLSMAIRSYLETIACLDLIQKQNYLPDQKLLSIRKNGHQLFIKLIAFRKSLS